jgi:hypothetical protein
MSLWARMFGGKGAAIGRVHAACANCGGAFEWPTSFKSGPVPIPAHVVDKAIYCPTCKGEFCIKCVRGKCPRCGSRGFEYVVPGSSLAG